jgi:hypothetical protein
MEGTWALMANRQCETDNRNRLFFHHCLNINIIVSLHVFLQFHICVLPRAMIHLTFPPTNCFTSSKLCVYHNCFQIIDTSVEHCSMCQDVILYGKLSYMYDGPFCDSPLNDFPSSECLDFCEETALRLSSVYHCSYSTILLCE